MEQYYQTVNLTDGTDMVAFAASLLSGRALTWWRSVISAGTCMLGVTSWLEFCQRIRDEFVDVDAELRLRRRLANLK